MSSSDLTPRAGSILDPLDVLGAAGMAAQRQPLGMMLQRLRAEPHGSHRERAADKLAALLREAVRQRKVRRESSGSLEISRQALDWWLDPTCRGCGGVKYVASNGRLTARLCPDCGGSGRRALETDAPGAAEWVLDTIRQRVAQSEAVHKRVLR